MRPSRTILIALARALLLLCLSAPADAVLLYDVDFGTPPHTVGQPPVTGAGAAPRATPTAINFGDPTVVAQVGALTDQPCSFGNGTSGYDQLEFMCGGPGYPGGFPEQYDCYHIEFDVLVEQLASSPFRFFFDTPTANSISFNANGTIRIFPGNLVIGNFVFGVPVLLEVDIDIVADEWTIALDGAPAHTGPITADLLRTVRMNLDGGAASDAGAVDQVRITGGPCGSIFTACDAIDFEDLPLGATYSAGDLFVAGGIPVQARPFYTTPGPCGGATTNNQATVVAAGQACRSGQEIHINNVNLDFEFGDPVSGVMVFYGEYGGTINLGLNDDCEVRADFVNLHGAVLGGVTVHVFDFGTPGQCCGVLLLQGLVETLRLGGQELWIDDIIHCEPCPIVIGSGFEDLPLDTNYYSGESLVTGGLTIDVGDFYYTIGGCVAPTTSGYARNRNTDLSCGTGQEVELNNVRLEVGFSSAIPYEAVISYGEWGGPVDFGINGECQVVQHLANLSGTTMGGVAIWVVDFGTPGQSCGRLYLQGEIHDLLIGGQELYLDRILACAEISATGDRVNLFGEHARRAHLRQNRPNPLAPETWIVFALPEAGRANLQIFDVDGRLVRTLFNGTLAAGEHDIRWDGLDAGGRRVPGGVYFYQLTAGGVSEARRMVVLE